MTSRRSDVTKDDFEEVELAEADFGKVGCGGDFRLDSQSCELPGESSW